VGLPVEVASKLGNVLNEEEHGSGVAELLTHLHSVDQQRSVHLASKGGRMLRLAGEAVQEVVGFAEDLFVGSLVEAHFKILNYLSIIFKI